MAKQFEAEGVVASKKFLVLLARITGADRKMQAGEYLLHTSMLPLEILDIIKTGRFINTRLPYQRAITLSRLDGYLRKRVLQNIKIT